MQILLSRTKRPLLKHLLFNNQHRSTHLQLDEQHTFEEPLSYDVEVSSDRHTSHNAPVLDVAKQSEQVQPVTT